MNSRKKSGDNLERNILNFEELRGTGISFEIENLFEEANLISYPNRIKNSKNFSLDSEKDYDLGLNYLGSPILIYLKD